VGLAKLQRAGVAAVILLSAVMRKLLGEEERVYAISLLIYKRIFQN
jgi:hypothetical protein